MGKGMAVKEWLASNDASEYQGQFEAQGFADIQDLDEEAIKSIVTKKGTQNRLIRDLAARNKVRDQPPPVPKLPAGTALDLSDPKFEGRQINLPSVVDTVAVETGKIISAMELDPVTQWPAIAVKRSILIGYRVTPEGVERAKFPALYWKIPEGTDFVQDMSDRSDITTRLTYSERSNSFAKAGFNKAALEASYFCASVAAEYSSAQSRTDASKQSALYMIAMRHYPRAKLFLEKCTCVSDKLQSAFRDALRTGKSHRSYEALQEVFKSYGHIVPRTIVLGGQLYIERVETELSKVGEKTAEMQIKAAISAKFGGFGGEVSAAHGEKTKETSSSDEQEKTESLKAIGGNTLKPSNPSDWAGSVADPNLWAIIAIEEAIDTIDLLEDEGLREQIREVLDKYGRPESVWALPVEYKKGARYRISAKENLLAPERTVLDKLVSRDAFKLKLPLMKFGDPAYKEQYARMVGLYEKVGHDAFEQRNLKPQLPPSLGSSVHQLSPILEDPQRGDDKVLPMAGFPGVCLADRTGKASTHCWRVVFSGERDKDDRMPLYWIQYIASGELLAWEHQLKNSVVLPPPFLVDPAAMDEPTGAGSGALWRIEPVDPDLGNEYASARYIVHHLTRHKLRVMGVCRTELGDDKRMEGGGPALYDPWRLIATSRDAQSTHAALLPREKAWRLNAACWFLTEVTD